MILSIILHVLVLVSISVFEDIETMVLIQNHGFDSDMLNQNHGFNSRKRFSPQNFVVSILNASHGFD